MDGAYKLGGWRLLPVGVEELESAASFE